ncbi:nucleoside deaminase [Lyngbya confervoides]|uniref:Nucleoside deaminase n=1 Tax=Lyngbya confervoides BDU141951 TaxID=1574623 RepID=A0ABD4T8Q1_9CYAN|nr:nucleoside deaminase [Lyngbya confervoides]MCM1984868.1 nucleoside deaminase [Lyngbya confervoides BDU141951]
MDWFMQAAIAEAQKGQQGGGIPIGSVLVKNNAIIGRGHNQRVQQNSAIHHAEMNALESIGRQSAAFYRDVTLYTTLSPCSMCTGAILLYKIPRVVIGENYTFQGEEALLQQRGVQVEVLNDPACIQLMAAFIQSSPQIWFEDIGTLESGSELPG